MADWLVKEGHDAVVIPALDLGRVAAQYPRCRSRRTPVALSYVIAHRDGSAELFIAPEKVTPELTRHLGNAVTVRNRDAFEGALGELGKNVVLDPDFSRGRDCIKRCAREANFTSRTRQSLPRRSRTPPEQQGHRDAQARDGAAVSRFLRWLRSKRPKAGSMNSPPPRGCRRSAKKMQACVT